MRQGEAGISGSGSWASSHEWSCRRKLVKFHQIAVLFQMGKKREEEKYDLNRREDDLNRKKLK